MMASVASHTLPNKQIVVEIQTKGDWHSLLTAPQKYMTNFLSGMKTILSPVSSLVRLGWHSMGWLIFAPPKLTLFEYHIQHTNKEISSLVD